MLVYHDFFLLHLSRSTFPEVDTDPAKWYGSNRIRIRNTVINIVVFRFRARGLHPVCLVWFGTRIPGYPRATASPAPCLRSPSNQGFNLNFLKGKQSLFFSEFRFHIFTFHKAPTYIHIICTILQYTIIHTCINVVNVDYR